MAIHPLVNIGIRAARKAATQILRGINRLESLDVTAKSFEVTPTPDGFVVIDPAAKAKRLRALDKLAARPPLRDEWPRP